MTLAASHYWHLLARNRVWRAYDWPLLISVLVTIFFGAAMIYSATLRNPTESAWDDLVIKQLAFALIGLAGMVMVSLTDYRILLQFAVWIYASLIVALVAVLAFGHEALGSQRWLTTGAADIQPGELAKVGLVICLAAYLDRFDICRFRHVIGSILITALPIILVIRQPNLSTAVILVAIWMAMVAAAGLRLVHASLLALVSVPLATVLIRAGKLESYWLERLAAWLNPMQDPSGSGFQHIQTLIAVGNGGLFGTGFASGQQSQGGWLPLLHTDNVFALVAEELGFVGAIGLLALLGFIVWRLARTGRLVTDRAGALIAIGVWSYFISQVFVNVGVVEQLLPITGVSLPFVSYGGSSLLALLLGIGLTQSVLIHHRSLQFR